MYTIRIYCDDSGYIFNKWIEYIADDIILTDDVDKAQHLCYDDAVNCIRNLSKKYMTKQLAKRLLMTSRDVQYVEIFVKDILTGNEQDYLNFQGITEKMFCPRYGE